MAFRWYNPLSWRMFGYTDPATGDYVEVDMTVGGRRTKSGIVVTPKRALSIPIVWSCLKVLSESGSGLPLKLYDDRGEERKLVTGSDRALRLLKKPHPLITRLNFLKAVIMCLGLRGNAYAVIERNGANEWIGTNLLDPDCVGDDLDAAGEMFYWYEQDGKRIAVSPQNMLHFKIFSLDGIHGLSPVEHQAEAMGLAKAAQDWSARFMRKGGFTGAYVIYDNFLTKEQQTQIMSKFPDVREGDAEGVGKAAILQGGPKIVPAGLSQKDAQFIESQQFQEEALAGIYGVPLWLANRASKTSIMGSNLEQQKAGFVTFGLSPYTKAIADEINDKIFGETTRFVEFVVEGLLQGDSAARATYYNQALGGSAGSGWMSIDEVREKENLPALGGAYGEVTRWEMQSNANET